MAELKSRRELALLATGGVVATALAATVVRSAAASQPNMDAARASLVEAMRYLEAAEADKGGYRAAAMESVKRAIEQVDLGIRYAAAHP